MDPTTILIGVAVTVVIGAVMMAITKFGFGGESEYEQTIALQKEILLDDPKNKAMDKKKGKADKKKKTVKSKGETTGHTSGSELEAESGKDGVDAAPGPGDDMPPHIEYDPDPVIIEPTAAPPPKNAKKGKKTAPKSILHNRDEVTPVRSEDAAIAQTVFPEASAPKDDLELKKSKKAGKKDKQKQMVAEEPQPVVDEVVVPTSVKSQASAPAPPQVVEEMIIPKAESTVSAAAAPLAAPKKTKGKSATGKAAVSDLAAIITVVQEAPLSKDELQTLVENILTRLESEDNWTTKGAKPDPLAIVRKQLEETQSALADEQNNYLSVQAKVKEVTAKWKEAEKQSHAATAQLQESAKRMAQTHEQYKAEIQKLNNASYADKQRVDQQQEVISQLSEENQRLKQSVANTDEVAQMQNQLRTLTTDKQAMTSKLADAEKAAEDSKHELAKAKESCKAVEGEVNDLKKRCGDLGQKAAQAENELQQSESKASEAEKNFKNHQDLLQTQLREKDMELQVLRGDLAKTKEQQLHSATNGSHTDNESTNGHSNEVSELETRISGLESTLSDKESQIASLNKQLTVARSSQNDLNVLQKKSIEEAGQRSDLEQQLNKSKSEVQALKDKNNELRRKIWTLNDSLEKAESSSLSLAAADRTLEDKICTINDLKDRNAKLLSQNNELQERCDSMSSLSAEVSSLMKEVNQGKVDLDNKDQIISQLERSLKEEEQKVVSSKSEQEVEKLNKQVAALRKDNQELEARVAEAQVTAVSIAPVAEDNSSQVTEYRDALTQVESMLDNLAAKVEKEHSKISVVLDSKDEQLTAVQGRLDAALKQLENSHSEQAKRDSAKVSDLTSQLEESKQKLLELEKILAENGSAAKAEAAAMAASGGGDDNGTCV